LGSKERPARKAENLAAICELTVASSIPDEVVGFFFNLPNPSSSNMALVFTQPLTETSTRNLTGE
jgi:hypothetical protein